MSTTCPSCGCSQPDGLLCTEDTAALQVLFAAIPQLVEQLNVAVTKQAKLTSTGKTGKGSAHERSPVNWGVAAVRDALLVEVALWGGDINAIRRHPQAGEIASGIGKAVKNAYHAIDRMQERKYLGQCYYKQGGLTCHAEIWVKPGAHQVKCTQCDYVHDVAVRREDMMVQAEEYICTPREASEFIGEYGEKPVGQQRIRNYLDRGRLVERPSPDSFKRFRFGDLMDLLKEDAARRERRAS